jgi:hypothetical protein
MTEHYIEGELSLLIAQLQAIAPDPAAKVELARLRHEVETVSSERLGTAVRHVLDVSDRLCWASLETGQTDAFITQVDRASELGCFAACAGLLADVGPGGPDG